MPSQVVHAERYMNLPEPVTLNLLAAVLLFFGFPIFGCLLLLLRRYHEIEISASARTSCSTCPTSDSFSAMDNSFWRICSSRALSRPLGRRVTLTLLPSSRIPWSFSSSFPYREHRYPIWDESLSLRWWSGFSLPPCLLRHFIAELIVVDKSTNGRICSRSYFHQIITSATCHSYGFCGDENTQLLSIFVNHSDLWCSNLFIHPVP